MLASVSVPPADGVSTVRKQHEDAATLGTGEQVGGDANPVVQRGLAGHLEPLDGGLGVCRVGGELAEHRRVVGERDHRRAHTRGEGVDEPESGAAKRLDRVTGHAAGCVEDENDAEVVATQRGHRGRTGGAVLGHGEGIRSEGVARQRPGHGDHHRHFRVARGVDVLDDERLVGVGLCPGRGSGRGLRRATLR